MVLSDIGKIVRVEILKTKSIRDNIEIDKYVIMPNHVHLIMVIWPCTGTTDRTITPCRGPDKLYKPPGGSQPPGGWIANAYSGKSLTAKWC